MADSKELEKQEYYHGYRPRKDVQCLLKDPGDFLVRATDNGIAGGAVDIVLSFMDNKKVLCNFTLWYSESKWQLKMLKDKKQKSVARFGSVVELLNHYKEKTLPGKTLLKKGIPRPNWLIKHNTVIFDKAKDHLGSGNFCHVYKGKYQRSKELSELVAVKICHEGRGATNKDTEEGREARNAMIGEAQIMAKYTHNNVIQLYGVACDHPPVLIVMEFCAGGNLQDHLKKFGDEIQSGERIVYAIEASRGMNYLHGQKCIHRDLAARNCLISGRGAIKIADFGLSKMVGELEDSSAPAEESPQIPLRWMAPESLKKPMKFSVKTDVWSFGVLMYEVFNNGEKPWANDEQFPSKKIATLIRKGQMPTMPDRTPTDIKELNNTIWQLDPHERPEMSTILRKLKASGVSHKAPEAAAWTLNKLTGVHRESAATLPDTTDTEDDATGTETTNKETTDRNSEDGENTKRIKRTSNRQVDRPLSRNLFRTGSGHSRSYPRSTARENLLNRPPIADRVTFTSKRRSSRSLVPDRPSSYKLRAPPALREVDRNLFEVDRHEVEDRPSAILNGH